MNLYVSNLGFQTSEDDLRKLFEVFGKVSSVKLITDIETGRSRGFGLVQMFSYADAQKAISELNGTGIEGRNISVIAAREKVSSPEIKK